MDYDKDVLTTGSDLQRYHHEKGQIMRTSPRVVGLKTPVALEKARSQQQPTKDSKTTQ
jgi:hypothetical protein